ncbi:MAG TPA: DUF1501 domain-containing protein [Burkholderiaceae bacterium]
MQRRDFLHFCGGLGMACSLPRAATAQARAAGYDNLLILIELKGGNDSLNMAVPYADPLYYQLRPKIALKREQVLQLDETMGFHPSMAALMPLWQDGQLAVVRGLGYPQPNLSHFRSIEIWDTASRSEQYLQEGWLTRAFAARATPGSFSADGVVVGGSDLGPMAGGARAIALTNTEQFLNNARLAMPAHAKGNSSLTHLLKVEADIAQAANGLRPPSRFVFKTEFPRGGFGDVVKTAAQVVANGEQTGKRVAVLRLSLGSFDTHINQQGAQAGLLTQLADGMAALRAALRELNRWDSTLALTYAEFGRRPKENLSNGTDHGTVATHLVMGGKVKGGLLGPSPDLAKLDGGGNLAHAIDFRNLYATVLADWWNLDAAAVLGGRFDKLPLLKV